MAGNPPNKPEKAHRGMSMTQPRTNLKRCGVINTAMICPYYADVRIIMDLEAKVLRASLSRKMLRTCYKLEVGAEGYHASDRLQL